VVAPAIEQPMGQPMGQPALQPMSGEQTNPELAFYQLVGRIPSYSETLLMQQAYQMQLKLGRPLSPQDWIYLLNRGT
jgi:hypothetical protein